jgi:transposase InsO family protein
VRPGCAIGHRARIARRGGQVWRTSLKVEQAIVELRHQAALPLANGKVERLNRTLITEWAYRQVFTSNDQRTAALAPWLEHYNTARRHSALAGQPPLSRLLPT